MKRNSKLIIKDTAIKKKTAPWLIIEESQLYLREVIFSLNTLGQFSQLNYAWTTLTGYTIQNSLQKELLSYLTDTAQAEQIADFFFKSELKVLKLELLVNTIVSSKWVDAFFYRISDDDSNISFWGTFIDINKGKEAHNMLMLETEKKNHYKIEKISLLNEFSHEMSSAQAGILSSVELLELIQNSKKVQVEQTNKHYSNIKAQVLKIGSLLDDFLLAASIL